MILVFAAGATLYSVHLLLMNPKTSKGASSMLQYTLYRGVSTHNIMHIGFEAYELCVAMVTLI